MGILICFHPGVLFFTICSHPVVIFFTIYFLARYGSNINRDAITYHCSFWIMTLKLQHPLTLIVAASSACGKPSFVITLLECREQLCDTGIRILSGVTVK
jgi:hypothetical protein